jgi:heme exporter protein A
LLRILAGLTEAAAGSVIRSQPFLFWGHASALKDELTAQENLELLHTHSTVQPRVVEHALARVHLENRAHVLARKLSAGQRRRVGLAWLSLANSRVWLLDEPTTALDADGVSLFTELLNAHLAAGGAAVISTHLEIASLTATPQVVQMVLYAG